MVSLTCRMSKPVCTSAVPACHSYFAETSSLEQSQGAAKILQSRVLQSFPLFFSLENRHVAMEVLSAVENRLRSSPFNFQGARIITGQEEGAYGWITINYLLGSFKQVTYRQSMAECSCWSPGTTPSPGASAGTQTLCRAFLLGSVVIPEHASLNPAARDWSGDSVLQLLPVGWRHSVAHTSDMNTPGVSAVTRSASNSPCSLVYTRVPPCFLPRVTAALR